MNLNQNVFNTQREVLRPVYRMGDLSRLGNSRKDKDSSLQPNNAKFYKFQIYFTAYQATSILFQLDPYKTGNELNNTEFKAIQEVMKQYVENGILKKSSIKIEHDNFLGDIKVTQVHRDDLVIFSKIIGINLDIELAEIPINHQPQNQTDEQQVHIAQLEAQYAKVKEENDKLKQSASVKSAVSSDEVLEYNGHIPLSTNEEKLAHFIDLLLECGEIRNRQNLKPTYSELYTILQHKIKNKPIPSKTTIAKYMNKTL